MELLLHMVALFLVFCKSSIVFSTENAPIYIPNNSAQGFPFLHILTNICYLCFLMTAILKSVRWYHIVVLICISRAVKSLLQYHNLKASVLQHSAFFMIQLSPPYMTSAKTVALTRWAFVSTVMPLCVCVCVCVCVSVCVCNKVLLKYKGGRESFWHRHQKRAERVPPF